MLAALVPLLAVIGASATTIASRADLEAVLRMLAGLAPHVPDLTGRGLAEPGLAEPD